MLSMSSHYLRILTRGGGGNQRECIISAGLLASLLKLCLVLPKVHPIFHLAQEHRSQNRSSYLPPYHNRTNWGDFGDLFDKHHFVSSLHKLGICVVDKVDYALPSISARTALPGLEIRKTWTDRKTWTTTFFWNGRRVRDEDLATTLSLAFAQGTDVLCRGGHGAGGVCSLALQMDTCWTGFPLSRGENAACQNLGACHEVTEALHPNAVIINASAQAVTVLTHRKTDVVWDALHLRAFMCVPRWANALATFKRVFAQAGQMASKTANRGLYLVSDVKLPPPILDMFQLQFGYNEGVVRKEAVLKTIWEDYPYEVVAQIDLEIGNALTEHSGGVYYAFEGSSSDAYLIARRNHTGAHTVVLRNKADLLCQ
mmetsp:Transcript_16908/g.28136  ORF Transcript_16908/g.28136 Transcript_16908/m.28136 type:complete len:370 (+) Transcript_16908:43-1152(+)